MRPASVHVFRSGALLLASAGLMEIDVLAVYSVQLWAGCMGVVEDGGKFVLRLKY